MIMQNHCHSVYLKKDKTTEFRDEKDPRIQELPTMNCQNWVIHTLGIFISPISASNVPNCILISLAQ